MYGNDQTASFMFRRIAFLLTMRVCFRSARIGEITSSAQLQTDSDVDQWRSNAIYRPWIFARNAAPP